MSREYEPPNPRQNNSDSNQPPEPMEITAAVELINNKLLLNQKIILDLFGGQTSQIPEAINIDLIAESGIKGSIPELLLKLPRESIDEIIASNPQAYFLSDAAPILKPGGRIYINATKRNPFRKLPNADTLEQLGLKVLQENVPLDTRFAKQKFFRQTPRQDGTLEIPVSSLKTTILEKLHGGNQQ